MSKPFLSSTNTNNRSIVAHAQPSSDNQLVNEIIIDPTETYLALQQLEEDAFAKTIVP
ncbi:unnamed protein product, partial [Rotaria sp. Silwood2]